MEPIDGTLSSLAIVSTDSRIDLAPGVFFTVGREKLSVDDVAEVRFTWDGVEPARAPSVEIVTTQGRSIRIPLQGGVITSISLGVVGSDRRPRSYQWIASRGERPSRPPREIIVISFPK